MNAIKGKACPARHLQPGTIRFNKVILSYVRQETDLRGEKRSVYRVKCNKCSYEYETHLTQVICPKCKGKMPTLKIHSLDLKWKESGKELPNYNIQVIAASVVSGNIVFGVALWNNYVNKWIPSVSLEGKLITHWMDFDSITPHLPLPIVTKPLIEVDSFSANFINKLTDPFLQGLFKTALFKLNNCVLEVGFDSKYQCAKRAILDFNSMWKAAFDSIAPKGLQIKFVFN
jgi:hypothetical protein